MAARATLAPNEARVLRVLLRVDTPLTGRAIARVTGLTQSTAQRTLTRLRDAGLVLAEPAPPSLLYHANREHLAMPAVVALLELEDELRTRIAEHVGSWPQPPASLVVFGSAARGDAAAGSDLDLLVVRPDATEPDDATWEKEVANLADRVQRWTGRRTSVIDMSRREAVEGMAEQEPFLVEADREGWLIAGQPLRELSGHQP